MDDLHLEADRIFGPCNDPSCPGSSTAAAHATRPDRDGSWRGHLRLVGDSTDHASKTADA